MKSIFQSACVLTLLFTIPSQAAFVCTNAAKNLKLDLTYSVAQGAFAKLEWEDVKKFYLPHGIQMKSLDSVVDPENEKTIHSVKDNDVHSFLVYAPESGTDTVWNLSLRVLEETPFQSEVRLVDMMGNQFQSSVTCEDSTAGNH